MPEDRRVRAAFTALAVGDAVGMPTEFMTRQAIKARFSSVDTLLRPDQGEKHANLPYASVTDDTEQNLYLLRAYRAAGPNPPVPVHSPSDSAASAGPSGSVLRPPSRPGSASCSPLSARDSPGAPC